MAFQTPDGTVSLVAQNKGDESLSFTIYDQTLGLGASVRPSLEFDGPLMHVRSWLLPF